MTRTAKILRYVAFAMTAVYGLVGSAFVVGETFMEPGGWRALWLCVLWLVPLVALSAFAAFRPEVAADLLVTLTALVVTFAFADAVLTLVPRDEWGPVAAIAVFALGVALGFLGLHRAALAGLLMLVLGLAQFAATVVAIAIHEVGGGPGVAEMLGGSSGVVVIPLVVVGALFLVAAAVGREPLEPRPTLRLPAPR